MGDYSPIERLTLPASQALVDACAVSAGQEVLDVAAGTGNFALLAAAEGASVVASDLTPKLMERGRERAASEGCEIEWVEADAEELPFEDASFERVLSAIGAMFAPRHDVTAAELVRVCAPGGMITMANWAPEGGIGDFFATLGKHMPPPPPGFQPPVLWGSQDHVRELFEPHGLQLEFDQGEVEFRFESIPAYMEMMETNFGPMVKAREALGDDWAAARADLIELEERLNRADDGSMDVVGEYLIVMARKP
jgi:SAM-dependent methyltransferase